ncbi:MAG: type I-U CRISPR-associated helicase/endonuclease Cas3 [Bryobacterales bacterium]|nr:type I-U CRISPR-associated helicase/endonuclease Cas3 [Bryobacterales bacterium]
MVDRPALPAMPGFLAFYRAVNGRSPFPWQARLARQVEETEEWPDEIGVPTGLGKTACLDIAVWWLASQADRRPGDRTAPTRVWWVVNRRILVDSTADHAERICQLLLDPAPDHTALRSVSARLASLSASGNPLEIKRLRGGFAAGTPRDPSQPAVILSTLPMYGSRLLFRGYGVSRSMRPIEAAMAGTDSLVLLDEAHLAPHLRKLLPDLADCESGAEPLLGSRSRPRLVSLTATGDPAGRSRFDLDDADERNETVRNRLDAAKSVELRTAKGSPERALAAATVELLKHAPLPVACLVFVNTPATARGVFERLRRQKWKAKAPALELLTGRTREHEAERIRQRILDPSDGFPANCDIRRAREGHLVVVATQTLEVGADIDADYLVTEGCGVRALTQRLGRLNRLGLRPHARGVYIHVPPMTKTGRGKRVSTGDRWPVYGEEPAAVLTRLQDAVSDAADEVKLSPRRVRGILGDPDEPTKRASEILPGLLWEWVKTTTPPAGEAPVEPYFSGIADPDFSVSVIWRLHVPADGERLWPRARDREAVAVPIAEARMSLAERGPVCRLGADGAEVENVEVGRLRPGDRIILPSNALLDEFGWNPSAAEEVRDLSLRESGLPLDAEILRRLCGISVAPLVRTALGEGESDEPVDRAEREAAAGQILEAAGAVSAPPVGWAMEEWRELLMNLSPRVVAPRGEVARLPARKPPRETPSDEHDEMSLGPEAISLAGHGAAVANRAAAIARLLGLPEETAAVIRQAALLHDIGKADRRFQRWLVPAEDSPEPVAKSSMPRDQWSAARDKSDWPRGGRHEDLSARLVTRWIEQHPDGLVPSMRDLLVHLVISHHGKGRPLVAPVPDGTATRVAATIEGVEVDAPADLELTDWHQPARFHRLNRSFGRWGLALLEAVVRRADHSVSAATKTDSVNVQ